MRPEGEAAEQGMRREVLRLMLLDRIGEALGRDNVFGPFSLRGEDMTVVILGAFDQETLEKLLREFSETSWMVAHAGIGEACGKPEQLKESYDSACEAMDACFQFDDTAVLRAEDLPDEGGVRWRGFFRSEEALFKALKQEDELQVRQSFRSLKDAVSRIYPQRDVLKMLVKSILLKADAFQRQGDGALERALAVAEHAGTLEEMLGAAQAWCLTGIKATQAVHIEQRRRLIREIDQYIEANYTNAKLTLNDVAKRVAMSPNYLSSLYKKECGRGIHDVLSELRIDKAREMLVKTDRNIGEIGEAVGYINPYYFSMSFKKVTQFTPSEYRRRNASGT
jgi:two-component system response regulator YesN